MRRLEYLITQVRNSTDNKDVNGISNAEIVGYFNDAQRYITTLIFKNNPYADFFKTQVVLNREADGTYHLPKNCYATNAISLVEASFGTEDYSRIKPIAESEFNTTFGYLTRDNKILVSGTQDTPYSLRVTYFHQLPTLDIRQAKVVSTVAGVSITLDAAPEGLYTMDDHCSTVDIHGTQVEKNIRFTNTSGVALLTTDTDGVTNSQYIVAGRDASNVSSLPDACETYLIDYVKQRIYTRNNYNDAEKQLYFTEQHKSEILSLFSKNKKDDDTVPITDTEFIFF